MCMCVCVHALAGCSKGGGGGSTKVACEVVRRSARRLDDHVLDLAGVLLARKRVEVAFAEPDRGRRDLDQLIVVTVRDGLLERLHKDETRERGGGSARPLWIEISRKDG